MVLVYSGLEGEGGLGKEWDSEKEEGEEEKGEKKEEKEEEKEEKEGEEKEKKKEEKEEKEEEERDEKEVEREKEKKKRWEEWKGCHRVENHLIFIRIYHFSSWLVRSLYINSLSNFAIVTDKYHKLYFLPLFLFSSKGFILFFSPNSSIQNGN